MGKRNKTSSRSKEADILLATIKESRERVGVSQREVARRLGFHPTIYGKIERGDRVLDVVEFVALAQAMGIDPLKLFGDYLIALQQTRMSADVD